MKTVKRLCGLCMQEVDMHRTLKITKGAKAEPLTDYVIRLQCGDQAAMIMFDGWEEMENLADNLINMSQALRNSEFNQTGDDNE